MKLTKILLAACFLVTLNFTLTTQAAASATSAIPTNGVTVNADQLEFLADTKTLIGRGNVRASDGFTTIRADYVSVQTESEVAQASGNVIFEKDGKVWTGEKLNYNFKTQQGDFGEFRAFVDPVYVYAASSKQISTQVIELHDVTVSTCEGEDPQFCGQAKRATLTDHKTIRAFNTIFYLGPVPIFYVPYYYYDLDRQSHWNFAMGYRNRWGAFLLATYSFYINPYIQSRTHFDGRTKRGLGIGQDFAWNNWQEGTNALKGILKTYYTHDNKPYRDDDERVKREDLVKETRYRVGLEHSQNLSERNALWAKGEYLSDPYMLEDFFPKEYKAQVLPENRVTLSHRGDNYDAGILVNKRLNNFYENIDRLPEASLNFRQQQIGDSPITFQGENSAAYLQHVFPNYRSSLTNYDAARVDTKNVFRYPMKYFGFLSFVPNAGWEGTFYSKTLREQTENKTIVITTTNVVGGRTNISQVTTNVTETSNVEGPAKLRSLITLGAETSFKAFKVWIPSSEEEGGLRHVAEPYINYAFTPTPNLRPWEIYQFDSIDKLDKQNTFRFGMRNKLQTKRSGAITDLIFIDTYTDYYVEHERDENDFGPFVARLRSYPLKNTEIDMDAQYDWYTSEIVSYNGQLIYTNISLGGVNVDYHYTIDRRNQMAFQYDMPDRRWAAGTELRYDFQDSAMQEQIYYVQRKTECLGIRCGYTGRGSDWEWWIQVWLLAFPESRVEGNY